MKCTWIVVRCPVMGKLADDMDWLATMKDEPWRTHALQCLRSNSLSSVSTMTLICMGPDSQLVAMAWISAPDSNLLRPFAQFGFLSHMYVNEKYRGNGFGRMLLEQANRLLKGAGVHSILLASGNAALRTRFYVRAGFVPISSDGILLRQSIDSITEHSDHGIIDHEKPVLRRASIHDVATAQSICGQRHWMADPNIIEVREPEECEEDFCWITSRQEPHFFLRGRFHERTFVSWLQARPKAWTIRLLVDRGSIEEVTKLASRLIHGLGNLRSYVENQIHIAERTLHLEIASMLARGD